jgi:hypothetical protein
VLQSASIASVRVPMCPVPRLVPEFEPESRSRIEFHGLVQNDRFWAKILNSARERKKTCPVPRLVPVLRSRIERQNFRQKQSYPPLFEALENLPEDVSRDKTRSSFAFQNREENFHPKTILPWGVRIQSFNPSLFFLKKGGFQDGGATAG